MWLSLGYCIEFLGWNNSNRSCEIIVFKFIYGEEKLVFEIKIWFKCVLVYVNFSFIFYVFFGEMKIKILFKLG